MRNVVMAAGGLALIVVLVLVVHWGATLSERVDSNTAGLALQTQRLNLNTVGLLALKLEGDGERRDSVRAWLALPWSMPVDSTGRVYLNQPWLRVTPGLSVGLRVTVRMSDSVRVKIDTLWDHRGRDD